MSRRPYEPMLAIFVVTLLAACQEPVAPVAGDVPALDLAGAAAVNGSISAGDQHACAVDTAGAAWCWGINGSGQLGATTSTTCAFGFACSTQPVQVSGGHTFVHVAAGGTHSCGLTAAGAAWCWGSDFSGQLGNGAGGSSTLPTAVVGDIVFTELGLGVNHSCGLANTGRVWCWGDGQFGQLGNGMNDGQQAPVRAERFHSSLAIGRNHSCAVAPAGGLHCWGLNSTGQLGTGDGNPRNVPTRAGTRRYVQAAAGNSHTCGLTDTGRVFCWGLNGSGQLGAIPPAPVPGYYVEVRTGESHTCARNTGGYIHCWGDNSNGALGNGGTSGQTMTRVRALGTTVYDALELGQNYSCAETASGRIRCWGSNHVGQVARPLEGGSECTGFPCRPEPIAISGGLTYLSHPIAED